MAEASTTFVNEKGRFDPNPNVSWYRSPIDAATLSELMVRSDLRGWIQTCFHLGLFFRDGGTYLLRLSTNQSNELVLVRPANDRRPVRTRNDRSFHGFDCDPRVTASNGV